MDLCHIIAADELKELVCVKFSEEGHSKEEQALVQFGDFLDECEGIHDYINFATSYITSFDCMCLVTSYIISFFCIIEGGTGCTSVFFSGADHIPTLGFIPSPKVSFLHSPTSLPVRVTSVYDYQHVMVMNTRHSKKVWFHRAKTMMVLVVFSCILSIKI